MNERIKQPKSTSQEQIKKEATTVSANQESALKSPDHSFDNVTVQKKNNTGLPDNLKAGIENLSGYSMDDVKVHYNSNKPTQLQAHAYAQGTEIHLGPGQEKHLPHEAWHVVQQKQGRVKPTMQMKGSIHLNDDSSLEKEADVMGAKALATGQETLQDVTYETPIQRTIGIRTKNQAPSSEILVQRAILEKLKNEKIKVAIVGETHGKSKDREMEKAVWKSKGISLEHEDANIDTGKKDGTMIAPDCKILRILFTITALEETCTKLRNGLDVFSEERKLALYDSISYLHATFVKIIEEAVVQEDKENISDFYKKLEKQFLKSKVALDEPKPDKLLQVQIDNINSLYSISSSIKNDMLTKHDHPSSHGINEYSQLRSEKMYENTVKLSLHRTNLIYKVGENHINEMVEMGMDRDKNVGLYHTVVYIKEYEALEQEYDAFLEEWKPKSDIFLKNYKLLKTPKTPKTPKKDAPKCESESKNENENENENENDNNE